MNQTKKFVVLLMLLVFLAAAPTATAATLNDLNDDVRSFTVTQEQVDEGDVPSCDQIYGLDWLDVPSTGMLIRLCTHNVLDNVDYTPGSSGGKFLVSMYMLQTGDRSDCHNLGPGWEPIGGAYYQEYCASYTTFSFAPGITPVTAVDQVVVTPLSACSSLPGSGWQEFGAQPGIRFCKHFATLPLGAPQPIVPIEPTPATLLVDLTANPSSGPAPLNDVDLTADVSGTATGNIEYRFDCTNDGLNEHTSPSTTTDPYTAVDVCDYLTVGLYTAKVVAVRGGKLAEDTTSINVGVSTTTTTALQTLYCRSDSRFATDLDTPAAQISDTALNTKNEKTCKSAGFKWTGTKCCSEDDDNLTTSTLREFYNDAGGSGGCWNSTLITSINLVAGTNESVLSYNGEFHGCTIAQRNFNTNNDGFVDIVDKHTGAPLIKNHNYCSNITEDTYFCSYTEKWMPTNGADRSHLSSAPFTVVQAPNQTAECCAVTQCWDGEKCVENQKTNPLAQPIGDGSRCIDGNWTKSTLKFSPDGNVSGFCPSNEQCLVDPLATDEKTQCINSNEFIGDNYCENGNWSTRTKLVAMKLLKLKSGDYNIFCDNKENALNVLQYQLASGEVAFNVLTSIQANNFCVLKTSGKTIVGVSINKNLTSTDNLEVFGVPNCANGLIYDSQYHSCDNTNKVWYNGKLQSIIFSTTAISIPAESDLLASFNQLIGTPIQNVINSIKRLITTPPVDDSYAKGIKKYDRLYIAQQGSKTITSSIENGNLIAEYKSFDNDICKYIEQFNLAKSDEFSGIACKKENNNFYVLAQGSEFTNLNPDAIWQDLTSKLRIK